MTSAATRTIKARLEEDEGGWDYYDDHPYEAISDLRTLMRAIDERRLWT